LHGATLEEHRQTTCKRCKRTTTVYRWLPAMPLRATADAIAVNWFSIEIFNVTGCEFQTPQKCLRLISVYAINFMP
jgi:hypothetical protein